MRRLILLAIVALGLAPGTFVRTATTDPDLRSILNIEPLEISQRELGGGMVVEGAWHLTSPNEYFGSYSGLVALGEGELFAVSDKGGWLRFDPARFGRGARFGPLPRANERNKHVVDAEAVDYDARSDRIWVAYEGSNSIERSDPEFSGLNIVEPSEMREWPGNSGPEAMARLADGRFLIVGESAPGWEGDGFPALMFSGDPNEGSEAEESWFVSPEGYRASDLSPLPDGRILVLMRAVESFIPPRFGSLIGSVDPAKITPGEHWGAEMLAALPEGLPSDNFEGLASVQRDDGSYTLWMISDDNGAFFQRTLLYKIHWTPEGAQP